MADIVGSLFGVTPEMYQQQQSRAADEAALQYAQLTPFQQAQFAIGRGAYGLAGAIGGALGAEDPQLKLISQRNAIAKQIDPTNPESMAQGIRALSQAGDAVGAMQLTAELRKLQSEMAQTFQRTAAGQASLAAAAREKTQSIPEKIQLAQTLASRKGAPGSPEYEDEYTAQLNRLTSAEKPGAKELQIATDIENTQSVIDELTNLPAGPERDAALRRASTRLSALERQLPQPKEAKAPDAVQRYEYAKTPEGGGFKGTFTDFLVLQAPKTEVKIMPGDKALADIPAFRASVQRTIDPQLKTINATEQALTAINNSLATGNFASYRAAQTQFARAISGAGDLSQKELKAAGADPSLLGGTADYLSTLFSSTPTTDTQNKIRSTLQAIQEVARKRAQGEVNQQMGIALRSPGYNPDAVKQALTFPELQGTTAPTSAAAPMYARNPKTGERIMSTDGGVNWTPVR